LQAGLDSGNYCAADSNDEAFEEVFNVERVEGGGLHGMGVIIR